MSQPNWQSENKRTLYRKDEDGNKIPVEQEMLDKMAAMPGGKHFSTLCVGDGIKLNGAGLEIVRLTAGGMIMELTDPGLRPNGAMNQQVIDICGGIFQVKRTTKNWVYVDFCMSAEVLKAAREEATAKAER